MTDGVKKINEWIMKDGRVLIVTKSLTANNLEGGTFFVNPTTGMLKYNNINGLAQKSWKYFEPKNIFEQKTIITNLIDDLAVTTAKINALAVTYDKLATDSVIETKIKTDAVTTLKIKDLNVTGDKLANLAVTEGKLAIDAVTTDKIKDLNVTTDKIAFLAITTGLIEDLAISNLKIANKTISAKDKIANKSISSDLIDDEQILSVHIKNDNVLTAHILDRQITSGKILDRNVTGLKIALNCLKDEHMVQNSINGNKLENLSVEAGKLADNSVINRTILNGAIDIDKLETNLKTMVNESIRVIGTGKIATVKGNLKVEGNIDATGNITGKMLFNNVYGDLAEAYVPTGILEPGDAVSLSLDGDLKVEKLNKKNQERFLGFVSDQYAACFGATEEELKNYKKVAVALVGRIKVKVPSNLNLRIGEHISLFKGEICNIGYQSYSWSIGKALENQADGQDYVLCQLWPR